MTYSRVQSHGHESQYIRISIPVSILDSVPLKAGALVSWEIIDSDTLVLKKVK